MNFASLSNPREAADLGALVPCARGISRRTWNPGMVRRGSPRAKKELTSSFACSQAEIQSIPGAFISSFFRLTMFHTTASASSRLILSICAIFLTRWETERYESSFATLNLSLKNRGMFSSRGVKPKKLDRCDASFSRSVMPCLYRVLYCSGKPATLVPPSRAIRITPKVSFSLSAGFPLAMENTIENSGILASPIRD